MGIIPGDPLFDWSGLVHLAQLGSMLLTLVLLIGLIVLVLRHTR